MSLKNNAKVCSPEELYFPVEMRDEPMDSNSEYSKLIVGVIDGREKKLNQCSPIYELIPNEDIFPSIESVLDNNDIEYTVEYRQIADVRFYADYVLTDKDLAYTMKGTNDKIQPMLRVQHSYNGMTKYKIIFGYFRLVCSNGMVVAVEEMKDYNLVINGKHTAQIIESFSKLDVMLNHFAQNKEVIGLAITGKYEKLGGSWVAKPEDRLKEILNVAKISAVENNKFNTVNDIMSRIMVEANNDTLGYDGKVNDFLIYNGINQYINDDSRYATAPETRIDKDSKVFEFMLETATN